MTKILVPREKTTLYLDYKTLKSLKEDVERMIQLYGEDAYINERQYDYGDGTYLTVVVKELETDKEYAKRLADEEKQRARQEIWDREQFDKLKKKFEGRY